MSTVLCATALPTFFPSPMTAPPPVGLLVRQMGALRGADPPSVGALIRHSSLSHPEDLRKKKLALTVIDRRRSGRWEPP
jgi:hypothetical protein